MKISNFLRLGLGLTVFAVFLSPSLALGYDPEVHAGLTREAIFFYNQFFKEQTIKSSELAPMVAGAREEDTLPRMLNHFYDPINDVGLHYAFKDWQSSKDWAGDSANQTALLYRPSGIFDRLADILGQSRAEDTDYTWNRAIKDYLAGEKERAFAGLGHILHLIEDLTVPAHTRNDPHPPFVGVDPDGGGEDTYERYTAKFKPDLINVLQPLRIGKKQPVILDSLDKYFDELASYTNTHFYSQDTIGLSYYKSPAPVEVIKRDGKPYQEGKDFDGVFPLALMRTDLFDKGVLDLKVSSDFVNGEYWGRLSQKAVQYGAGVIDLFFKEVAKRQSNSSGGGSAQALSSFQLEVEPGFGSGIVELKVEAPKAAVLSDVVSLESNDELEAQVASAQEAIDGLRMQIDEVESLRQVLGENVEGAQELSSNVDWVPSIQFGTIIMGGGGVSSAPAPVVEEGSEEEVSIVEENVDSGSPASPKTASRGGEAGMTEGEGGEVEESAEVDTDVEPEPVVDTQLPGTITTLSLSNVGTSTLTLVWMAVGDDDDLGRAAEYDIRFGLEEITDENWGDAQRVEDVPEPSASYVQEEFLVTGLEQDTEYYFAIKAVDEEGNAGNISNNTSWRTLFVPEKIVISEVFVDMVGADNMEFIELYNPNGEAVDLEKWSVQYASGSADEFSDIKKKNFEEGAVVEAKSFYLVGLKDYEGEADMTWSQSLNNSGGVLWLVASQEVLEVDYEALIVDRLDYGVGEGGLLDIDFAVELPRVGKSLERRALVSELCVDMDEEHEFFGNACDAGVKSDFVVREVPTPQGRVNFPEPREKPTSLVLVGNYRAEDGTIDLSWSESVDWRGETGVSYGLSEDGEELLQGEEREFNKKILEINRDYGFEVQSFDAEGLGSEVKAIVINVPSYLSSLRWYFDSASSTEEEPVYRLEMAWEEYPFILAYRRHPALGKVEAWHVMVLTYNNEPVQIETMGEWFESYGWGAAINMVDPFWVIYPSCNSNKAKVSGVIFADTPEKCSYLMTPPQVQSLNKDYYGDGGVTLSISNKTFKEVFPGPDDYITVSYYAFDPGANFNSNQRLVAIDRHRYYLEVGE